MMHKPVAEDVVYKQSAARHNSQQGTVCSRRNPQQGTIRSKAQSAAGTLYSKAQSAARHTSK